MIEFDILHLRRNHGAPSLFRRDIADSERMYLANDLIRLIAFPGGYFPCEGTDVCVDPMFVFGSELPLTQYEILEAEHAQY